MYSVENKPLFILIKFLSSICSVKIWKLAIKYIIHDLEVWKVVSTQEWVQFRVIYNFFFVVFKSYVKQLTFSKIYMKIFFIILFYSFYKFLFLTRVRYSTSETKYGCKNVTALLSNFLNFQIWFFKSFSIYILRTLETIFAEIIR